MDTDPDPALDSAPYHLDPDPALFVRAFKMPTKNMFYFADYYLKVHLHQSSKIKSHKEVTKQ
jgi:hypothetical protein